MGRNPKSFTELGVTLGYDTESGIRMDDLNTQLRGQQGIRRFREMRDDDPTVGAVLAGIEMLSRGAKWTFRPSGDTEAHHEAAEFMQSVMDDMDFTFEEFLSDAMTMLPFGFSLFEIVLKRRDDGLIGIRKLGPRAQWTIDKFVTDPNGTLAGAYQNSPAAMRGVFLPASKILLFRTTSANCDPAGRSILRNAYRSYLYVRHIQEYEAVAIERELNGMPVGRVPSEYLRADADAHKVAFVNKFKQILRDVKKNAQGYILLPSDVYEDVDGKPSAVRMVEFELLASKGTRDIDTRAVIQGHQQDIARTVLADFLMLGGGGDRGSFAMSKSKTDVFVKAMTSFLNSICNPINRRLVTEIWEANGLNPELKPVLGFEDMAPMDIDVLGKFLRSLALAGARIFPNVELENAALKVAGMPELAEKGEARDVDANAPKVAAPGAKDENDDQEDREDKESTPDDPGSAEDMEEAKDDD